MLMVPNSLQNSKMPPVSARQHNVLCAGHIGNQVIILKDKAEGPAAEQTLLSIREGCNILVSEQIGSLIPVIEQTDKKQKRALSASRSAGEHNKFSGEKGCRKTIQHLLVPVTFADIAQHDPCRRNLTGGQLCHLLSRRTVSPHTFRL